MVQMPQNQRMTERELVQALQAFHRRFITRVVPATDADGRACLDVEFAGSPNGDSNQNRVANR